MTGELPRTRRSAVGTSWQPTSERTSQAYNCQKQAPAAFNIMLPATSLQNPDRAKGRVPQTAGCRAKGRVPPTADCRLQDAGPTSDFPAASSGFPNFRGTFAQLPGGLCATSGGPLCNLLILKELIFQAPKSIIWQPKQPFSST